MWPNPWAWRSHAQLALQLRDRLGAKVCVGAARAKASIGDCLGNRRSSPASFGQLLDPLAELRIGTQLTQLAHRSNHDALSRACADPLDAHFDPLATALHIYDDPFDHLADDLLAISYSSGWGGPEPGDVRRQMTNRLPFGFVSSRRGLCWTNR